MDTENFTSHPYFHFGYLERILIRSWQIQSIAGLIIACIGAFIVAYLLEALNIFFYSMNLPRISLKSTKFREMLHVKSESRQNSSESIQESITSVDASLAAIHHCDKPPLPEPQNPAKILENIVLFYDRLCSLNHGFHALLHSVRRLTGFILMLIVMSYNVWLFTAVILGATLGYLTFGWYQKSN